MRFHNLYITAAHIGYIWILLQFYDVKIIIYIGLPDTYQLTHPITIVKGRPLIMVHTQTPINLLSEFSTID